jgi:hypothetical protein
MPSPAPTVSISDYTRTVQIPERIFIAMQAAGDQVWKRIKPVSDSVWQEEDTPVRDGLESFSVTEPGEYEIGLRADSPGQTAQTGSRRVVTVTAEPLPPPVEPVLVTTTDLEAVDIGIAAVRDRLYTIAQAVAVPRAVASYATLRAAGQPHAQARDAVVAEVWEFVEAEIADAKGWA